jgi:hypothetical protein
MNKDISIIYQSYVHVMIIISSFYIYYRVEWEHMQITKRNALNSAKKKHERSNADNISKNKETISETSGLTIATPDTTSEKVYGMYMFMCICNGTCLYIYMYIYTYLYVYKYV